MAVNHRTLGPLFTISDEELNRPARRREDRDVLVLRIEVEAQRREVARLMTLVGSGQPLHELAPDSLANRESCKVLLSARELRSAFNVSNAALYRWVKGGTFPPQIHVGRLARWNRADVDVWLKAKKEEGARQAVARQRPQPTQRVKGGRSRWAPTSSAVPAVTEGYVRNSEPQPTPLRGMGWQLKPGVPEPVPLDHPDYGVPRFRLQDAARYVGLPDSGQWDLCSIPHGGTNAMHYCLAQSDLDEFKSTLKPRRTKKPKD
jgi:predicted DNA-binding transcriptional regulator AlpA